MNTQSSKYIRPSQYSDPVRDIMGELQYTHTMYNVYAVSVFQLLF